MPPGSAPSWRGRGTSLVGRDAEGGELDSLLEGLRRGESRAVVIRGEAGGGKTALLEYLTERAADCRVMTVTAVQSEMELAFAALHQLCAPIFAELELLPGPQREALGITFGLREGPVPDRVLGFVARRLGMESVGLVFAARVPTEELTGLPQLVVEGLPDQDSQALL